MSPLLTTFAADGISAFGFSRGGAAAGSYELISTSLVTSTVSSVVLTNSGAWTPYKHLQIRITARADTAGSIADNFMMRFNADTGSNYFREHYLKGNGSSVTSGSEGTSTSIFVGSLTAANATTNVFASNIIDILDHAGTKNKTTRSLNGYHSASFPQIKLSSGLWMSTAGLSSITFSAQSGNLVSGSRFSIYGIKG